jgi:replicative DNA helicase
VRSLARQRAVTAVLLTKAAEGRVRLGNVAEWLLEVQSDVCAAAQDSGSDPGSTLADLVPPILEAAGGKARVELVARKSSLIDLGGRLGGYKPRLYLVAGRPGMGKTSLLLQECLKVPRSDDGTAGVFLSLEMDRDELAGKLVSQESGQEWQAIASGKLDGAGFGEVAGACNMLQGVPLAIDYRPGASVAYVKSAVRRRLTELQRKHGRELRLGIVCVDYVQLMSPPKGRSNREQELSDISRGLMTLPAEFGCPVLVGSQLNRELERRPDKRPQLSDLRESGSLEQDAYGVIMLYRDDFYHEDSPDAGTAEILVRKLRMGQPGTIRCKWVGRSTKFLDLYDSPDYAGFDVGF